jgi:hypothetical protein
MPYDERDVDTGQFKSSYDDEEFLNAVASNDLPSTSAVADAVGCGYRTAYDRLRRLEDNGAVVSRTVGNSLVWLDTDL